jgi:hypothetical protein
MDQWWNYAGNSQDFAKLEWQLRCQPSLAEIAQSSEFSKFHVCYFYHQFLCVYSGGSLFDIKHVLPYLCFARESIWCMKQPVYNDKWQIILSK